MIEQKQTFDLIFPQINLPIIFVSNFNENSDSNPIKQSWLFPKAQLVYRNSPIMVQLPINQHHQKQKQLYQGKQIYRPFIKRQNPIIFLNIILFQTQNHQNYSFKTLFELQSSLTQLKQNSINNLFLLLTLSGINMKCLYDEDCGFLFHCNPNLECQHDSVFPLSIFTILIYLLIPIACGMVNSTGHSMGLFKVLIVASILRYQGTQATMVSQALIVGSALPNYFTILVRKHPVMPTSLVNFNLVYILVPCCLLGSTLGALVTEFIPNLVQQVLTFLVFSYFSWSFYQKYRRIKLKQIQLTSSILTNESNAIVEEDKTGEEEEPVNPIEEGLVKATQSHLEDQLQIDPNLIAQRNQILQYEKSIHLKDILLSILVFIVFQLFVFLVQGRLPFLKFSQCNWKYWAGIALLTLITFAYIKFIHKYLKQKFDTYQKLKIKQEIMLNKDKEFNFFLIAGMLAGLVQGILGLGSGSTMMIFFFMTPINTSSASATTGYQVLFIGLSALIEGFINGSVILQDTAFFIVLCVVLGGAVTVGMAYFLQTRNQVTVSKIVVIIATCLSLVSVIMVVPDVVNLLKQSGFAKTMEIKFEC